MRDVSRKNKKKISRSRYNTVYASINANVQMYGLLLSLSLLVMVVVMTLSMVPLAELVFQEAKYRLKMSAGEGWD